MYVTKERIVLCFSEYFVYFTNISNVLMWFYEV
jgi:hypothetical protein